MKIWNNGPLIPDKVRDQIMAPFFTTKEEGEGVGLGLAVSKAIMHVHGDDLSFTSDKTIKGIFTMSNIASARDLKGDLQSAGATGFFEKPFDAESFSFIIKLLDSATLDAADKASA